MSMTTSLMLVLSMSALIALTSADFDFSQRRPGSVALKQTCQQEWLGDEFDCSTIRADTICGGDGVTYMNSCWLCYFMTKKNLEPTFSSTNSCPADILEEGEIYTRKIMLKKSENYLNCSWHQHKTRLRDCHRHYRPVCGKTIITDTFFNECYLCKFSLWFGVVPEILHHDYCHDHEVDRSFYDSIGWGCQKTRTPVFATAEHTQHN